MKENEKDTNRKPNIAHDAQSNPPAQDSISVFLKDEEHDFFTIQPTQTSLHTPIPIEDTDQGTLSTFLEPDEQRFFHSATRPTVASDMHRDNLEHFLNIEERRFFSPDATTPIEETTNLNPPSQAPPTESSTHTPIPEEHTLPTDPPRMQPTLQHTPDLVHPKSQQGKQEPEPTIPTQGIDAEHAHSTNLQIKAISTQRKNYSESAKYPILQKTDRSSGALSVLNDHSITQETKRIQKHAQGSSFLNVKTEYRPYTKNRSMLRPIHAIHADLLIDIPHIGGGIPLPVNHPHTSTHATPTQIRAYRTLTPRSSADPHNPPSTHIHAHTSSIIRRKSIVRYHSQLNPKNIAPLLISIVKTERNGSATTSKQTYRSPEQQSWHADPHSHFIRIVPILPGCLVSPPETIVHLHQEVAEAEFWITPLTKGDLQRSARIQIWHENTLKDEINIPTRIATQLPCILLFVAAVCFAVLGLLLKTYDMHMTPPQNHSFTALYSSIPFLFGKAILPLSACAALSAWLCYLWRKPKQGKYIEKLLSQELS
ncbi:MAG: hypothetical protein AAGJ35_00715 [Myxococcota bacterium]